MTRYEMTRRIDTKCQLGIARFPNVVSIGFTFGENHSGDESIFFGIVLRDEPMKLMLALFKVAQDFLRENIDVDPNPLFYFSPRSESEMIKMWAEYPPDNQNVAGYGWEDALKRAEVLHRQTESQLQPAGGKA
jgi:hypothetical protein